MDTIKSKYAHLVGEIVAHVPKEARVSELDVYQEGISQILPFIDAIIADHLEDGSRIGVWITSKTYTNMPRMENPHYS